VHEDALREVLPQRPGAAHATQANAAHAVAAHSVATEAVPAQAIPAAEDAVSTCLPTPTTRWWRTASRTGNGYRCYMRVRVVK
jgi:hypothetical protein